MLEMPYILFQSRMSLVYTVWQTKCSIHILASPEGRKYKLIGGLAWDNACILPLKSTVSTRRNFTAHMQSLSTQTIQI